MEAAERARRADLEARGLILLKELPHPDITAFAEDLREKMPAASLRTGSVEGQRFVRLCCHVPRL